MSLTLAISGLPDVGDSTLFNATAKHRTQAADWTFATIEPNLGVVPLPDPRMDTLAETFGSEMLDPAAVSCVDVEVTDLEGKDCIDTADGDIVKLRHGRPKWMWEEVILRG